MDENSLHILTRYDVLYESHLQQSCIVSYHLHTNPASILHRLILLVVLMMDRVFHPSIQKNNLSTSLDQTLVSY